MSRPFWSTYYALGTFYMWYDTVAFPVCSGFDALGNATDGADEPWPVPFSPVLPAFAGPQPPDHMSLTEHYRIAS